MYRSGVLGLIGICASCSGPPLEVNVPARVPPRLVAGPAPAVALTRAAPPESLMLTARWKRPVRTLAALGVASIDDVFGKTLPALSTKLLPDAPVEMVVAIAREGTKDPVPSFALSFGLTSLEAGREYARGRGSVVEADGVLYLQRTDEDYCAVAPALGVAPARLVCGEGREALAALLPYAARGLPLEPLPDADVAVQLHIDAFRRVFGPELAELDSLPDLAAPPSHDDPTSRLVHESLAGLVREWKALFEDSSLLSVALDLGSEATPMVHMKASFHFERSASWTTGLLREWAHRAAAPPDSFWRLPADASAASYVSELNPVAYHHLRRTLGDVAQAGLADKHATAALQTRVRRIANETFTLAGGFVWASGGVPDASKSKLSAVAERARRELGWHVIGMDRGSAPYRAYLEDVRGLANMPELLRLLDLEVRRMPPRPDTPMAPVAAPHDIGEVLRGIRERGKAALGQLGEPAAPASSCWPPGNASCGPPPIAETVTVRRPRGARLPAGSVMFEVRVPDSWLTSASSSAFAKAPPKRGSPLTVAVVLVPDDSPAGSRTWLGISADERLIAEKLATALKGGQETLASQHGFEVLKQPAIMSGFLRWPAQHGGSQGLPYLVTAKDAGPGTELELTTELPLQSVLEGLVPLAATL